MTSCGCGFHDAAFTRPFHEHEDPTLCRACFVQVCEEEFIALEEKMVKLRTAHLDHSTHLPGGVPPIPLATNDERRLRRMLAHSYSGAALYCDDGELQDGQVLPAIDFLRDSTAIISRNMKHRAQAHWKESLKEKPCDTSSSS